jgi:hypothetical protein
MSRRKDVQVVYLEHSENNFDLISSMHPKSKSVGIYGGNECKQKCFDLIIEVEYYFVILLAIDTSNPVGLAQHLLGTSFRN